MYDGESIINVKMVHTSMPMFSLAHYSTEPFIAFHSPSGMRHIHKIMVLAPTFGTLQIIIIEEPYSF